MTAVKLTKRQQEILDYIKQTIHDSGAPPTRAEIASEFGFRSPNAAEDHLHALARKGVIELVGGTSRGIRLRSVSEEQKKARAASLSSHINPLGKSLVLPLIGRVAAGSPIFSEEQIEKTLTVQETLFELRPDYLLKVRGMSMRDAGIMEGDLLAVKSSKQASSGQIVVARIDGEVTVKRLQFGGSKIILLPENPDFEPIEITSQNDFEIEGIAVGLIRDMRFH